MLCPMVRQRPKPKSPQLAPQFRPRTRGKAPTDQQRNPNETQKDRLAESQTPNETQEDQHQRNPKAQKKRDPKKHPSKLAIEQENVFQPSGLPTHKVRFTR